MCDYSLMFLNNVLAEEGQELLSFRYNGSVGFSTPTEVRNFNLWSKDHPRPTPLGGEQNWKPDICVHCIPPGARLTLSDIPQHVQEKFGITVTETVIFDQLSASVSQHRDAVRFANGKTAKLTDLGAGISARVDSLEGAGIRQPIGEVAYSLL